MLGGSLHLPTSPRAESTRGLAVYSCMDWHTNICSFNIISHHAQAGTLKGFAMGTNPHQIYHFELTCFIRPIATASVLHMSRGVPNQDMSRYWDEQTPSSTTSDWRVHA